MSFDLPTLPDDWQYVALENCCAKSSVTYGVVQPGSALQAGKPIVRVNNFRDTQIDVSNVMYISPEIEAKYERTRLKGGEILLTIVGSVGQVAVVPPHLAGFNVARAVAVLHPLPSVQAEWIALCLRSPLSQHLLGSRANTTVQTTINLKDLRALPIPLPLDSERRTIASFIGVLDDRIVLLRETNATLEAIARALFNSWFVDFDPVRAKMEGRAPEDMGESTAALFPAGFFDSEFGLLPEGWRLGRLGDVARTIRRQLSSSELHAGLSYVGLEHIPRKSLSLLEWGTADGLESAKSAFQEGDILFGKLRPYFHKVVIAPFDGVCSTDVLVCQAAMPAYYGFVVMQLFSKALVDYAERLSNGAKMPRVSWADLANYAVVIPDESTAAAFTALVSPLFERIKAGAESIRTLASLRDTLLPRLISGQLRLPESQRQIDEAIAA